MVVVAAPHTLLVVVDVAVVMTALSRAIMDANTVQVVSHIFQRRILVLKQVLLSLNLSLKLCDLLFDLCAVGVEHVLHDC